MVVPDPRDAPGAEARPEAPHGVSSPTAVTEFDLDVRSVMWFLAAFVALVAATGLVRSAPRALAMVAVGCLLGVALDPLVAAVERRLSCRRPAAVAVVMFGLLAVVAAGAALLAPPAIEEGRRLSGDANRVVRQIDDLPIVGDDLRRAGTARRVERWIEDLPARLTGEDSPIGEAALRLADGMLVAFATLLVTVTLLLDGPRLVRGARRLVPRARRSQADRVGGLAYETVSRYVAGSLLVAALAGVATLIAGLTLGVPLAPLVAVWVAVFDLVPQIGGAAGGVPFVLLGLSRGAGTAVACAVFFILYLQFENHILSPLVVGRAVKLSPPATMAAALIGVSAAGVVGALLAVPTVAAAKVVYVELRPPGAPNGSERGLSGVPQGGKQPEGEPEGD